MRATTEKRINTLWYGESRWYLLLLPLSWLFAAIVWTRQLAYRIGFRAQFDAGAPVLVVGNVTAGGTGKTPITLLLFDYFRDHGRQPAIVSRGYAGRHTGVLEVTADTDVRESGDEALMMARRTGSTVYVSTDRVAAAKAAVAAGANMVICDDGLQHYRLKRQAEIAVVDGSRGLGNGALLPAGPLREPASRLASVTRVLVQIAEPGAETRFGNRKADTNVSRFYLDGDAVVNLRTGETRDLASFSGQSIHAIAGIGNPSRFFERLERERITIERHEPGDHASLTVDDLELEDERPVLMTEKDAVRCLTFASDKCWYLPVAAAFEDAENQRWLDILRLKYTTPQDSK